MSRFFKDDVQKVEEQRISDGQGGVTFGPVGVGDVVKVFLDTPSAADRFYTNQIQKDEFDRFMYYPYGMTFEHDDELQHLSETGEVITVYRILGKPEDQGGRNRYMRALLKEV